MSIVAQLSQLGSAWLSVFWRVALNVLGSVVSSANELGQFVDKVAQLSQLGSAWLSVFWRVALNVLGSVVSSANELGQFVDKVVPTG